MATTTTNVCPECGKERPGDERVAAGMKCGICAYAGNGKCPDCGHPNGSCGGDFLNKDDAVEFVADNCEPPDYS